MSTTHDHEGNTMDNPTEYAITYKEACRRAEDAYRRTNGVVVRGEYLIRFENGSVLEVGLRVNDNGVARPVDYR